MSEEAALRAAVCAAPDDDLPRLVYADFVEDRGDADRAAFIRTQVELARTPPWEPLAVDPRFDVFRDGRAERTEWLAYRFPNAFAEWADGVAFHRGFGYRVESSHPPELIRRLPEVMAREPVGELRLGTATLDQWRELAQVEELRRIRGVTFGSLTTPIEPLRVMRESENFAGVRAVDFWRADSPGWGALLEELFATPFGRGLMSLRAACGIGDAAETFEALTASARQNALRDLKFLKFAFRPDVAHRPEFRAVVAGLSRLGFHLTPLGDGGLDGLLAASVGGLEVLQVSAADLTAAGMGQIAQSEQLAGLKQLDLSDNRLGGEGIRALAGSDRLAGLRSLALSCTGCDDRAVRLLTHGPIWPNLVDLDLRRNPISPRGARFLRAAPPAPHLTRLQLSARPLGAAGAEVLRRRYGPALVVEE